MPTPEPSISGYRELAQLLRGQILDGTLPPGARVPSESTLGQQYGLSRDTVRGAIDLLRREGRVVVRHGHPTRVADYSNKIEHRLEPGSKIEAWMPTPEQQDALGIPDGVPVLQVIAPDGDSGDIHPAHRVRLVVPE